jgi:uncharacterized protein (TIGR03435 family)
MGARGGGHDASPANYIIPVAVTLLGAMLTPQMIAAQDRASSAQTFEVATVKINRSGERRPRLTVVPAAGRMTLTNISVQELIQDAYGLAFPSLLANVPESASQRVDVIAKAPSPVPVTVLQHMLQPLLADYFKLSTHFEMREMDVFAMVLARPGQFGPQLTRSLDRCDDVVGTPGAFARAPDGARNERGTCGILPGGAGRVVARGVDMPGLAAYIGTSPGRMVIDRTGVPGRFDVDLTYTPSVFANDGTGRSTREAPPGVDPAGPPLITALQDQLGLKLEPIRASIGVLVVDRLEPMTVDGPDR